MRAQDIHVGDRLTLKRDNAYGFGPRVVTITDIIPRDGYTVPWIRGCYRWINEANGDDNLDFGMFKPSDFSGGR